MDRNEYVSQMFAHEDEVLQAVRESIVAKGMPPISVPPELGRFLGMLVKLNGAKRVVEIGALGGYSGICLARALPSDGLLTSLELNPEFAAVAEENVRKAGLGERVEYRLGLALDSLHTLASEGAKFDLFFIDADKENYPNYLELAIQLANPGAVITADNVLLGDRVLNPDNHDPSVIAMRKFNDQLATDDRLDAMLLAVRDGFAIARVK